MPEQARGGSRGGRGGDRGQGGERGGGGHNVGPGNGCGRGRSLSSSHGVGGRNGDPSIRGARKVRGGGGRGRRGNMNRHNDPLDFLEKKIPTAPPSVEDDQKTAVTKPSSKKGKKRGKEQESVTVDDKQSKEMSLKTPIAEPLASSSPAPPPQSSPSEQPPPAVFASQDVRFKQKPTMSASPAKSPKCGTGIKNHQTPEKVKPPKSPRPSVEAATKEKAPNTAPLSCSR